MTQEALFYGFTIGRHVPESHLLWSIDRFVDLSGLRSHLRPFYSEIGRPSIDPELIIRMLIVGYCFGIRSERRLCEEEDLSLSVIMKRGVTHWPFRSFRISCKAACLFRRLWNKASRT